VHIGDAEDHTEDIELDFAYRHASALIFASRAEGFGLPLVEAMHYGLPVLASDIPIFHEIGGEYPIYFDPDRSESLLAAVLAFESAVAHGTLIRRAKPWLSWEDSTRMLLSKVVGAEAS
ncbi:MAG: glycosyltransferase, partial [Burkholderiaceae bacterium]